MSYKMENICSDLVSGIEFTCYKMGNFVHVDLYIEGRECTIDTDNFVLVGTLTDCFPISQAVSIGMNTGSPADTTIEAKGIIQHSGEIYVHRPSSTSYIRLIFTYYMS